MRSLLLGLAMLLAAETASSALASGYTYGYGHRHYYSGWSYNTGSSYYYRRYYYKPYTGYSGYKYHYCTYYPSQPRYVYYYNPHSRRYWGRLDLEGKEGAQYSLLAEKDRKEKLEDIPESAFPKPGALPKVPDGDLKDDLTVPAMKDGAPKKLDDLPKN